MRRPLNWVVVGLSLLFLIANLEFGRKPPVAGQTTRLALAESNYTGILSGESSEPQFGYVRADGSFLPLTQERREPAIADVDPAVYVWSSPVSASKVPASF
jgi:hypothetical protein